MNFYLPTFFCAKDDFFDYLPIIFFVGIAVLVVCGIAYSFWREKKRAEAWEQQAMSMGFTYSKENVSVQGKLNHFKLFSLGRSRKLKNVLMGESSETQLVIADYQYTTGSGKNSSTHRQTFCAAMNSSLQVPHFFLRRQSSFFDYLGKMFGGQDIDFDEDPEFSSSFVLQGDVPGSVEKLFEQGVRNYFVENKGKAWQIEARGPAIIVHNGGRVKPHDTRELMEMAFGVLQLLQQHTEAAPAEPEPEDQGFSAEQDNPFGDTNNDTFWSS